MTIQQTILDRSFSLEGLEERFAAGLAALARTVKLEPGKALFRAGDPGNGFYVVMEGSLKVCVNSCAGSEQLLAMLGVGSVVGELSLFDGQPRSATVVAVKPTRLAFVEKSAFERFADDNPAVYRHILRIVGQRLRQSNDALAARSFLPLPGRVAQTLLHLAVSFGRPLENERMLIHYKISQSDIASMAGGARENVSRVLNDWKRVGTISRISGYYCIEDRRTLEAAATL